MTDHAPPPPLDEPPAERGSSMFTRPPGWLVAGIAVVLGLLVLWLLSYPGGGLGVALLSGFGLAVVLAVWAVRTVTFGLARRRGEGSGNPVLIAIVPVTLLVVLLLGVTSTPAKARFSLAKGDFEELVDEAPAPVADPAAEPQPFDVPDRVGSFDIDKAYRQGDAVIFFVPGGFFSNVGFAYLPSGPFDELETGDLENVAFSKLSGDWYSFATST